ncbi:unnamed protein product [Microthlaspi erraticum]|uniref:Knottin scorpion toxin-like domain-containing protein n=1 Tax=Microthlaspi erraticum TaxID=1685480 RepID=A0A6D2KYI1_9BRAS|nr:unnamed protein product [Microthlaspi erraticum]
MAKTLNSICFTALLLVVLLISAEIPKSEAQPCNRFLGEGAVANPCTNSACQTRCPVQYRGSCRATCEPHDGELHCHCYAR